MKTRRELSNLQRVFLAALSGTAALVAPVAHAQVTQHSGTAKPGRAAIVGVVVDSLHGGYLVDAEVLVEGARTSARTDSLGRFTVDSLLPGSYQVGIFHPVLDTLGIALGTKPFNLAADSASVVVLGVPSAATLVAQSCTITPGSPGSHGNSAVIGHVVDPETLRPVAGADVSLAWVDFEVAKKSGIKTTPRVVRDSTDNFGRFSLCGLPSGMEANLQAKRGISETAPVTIALGESPTALFARTLFLSSVDSGTTLGKAVVSGRVILEGNPATAGTRVTLAGTNVTATTDTKGEFALRNLPSGTHVLLARHVGYAATAVSVDLSSRESKTVSITLPKAMNIMEPVLVVARRTRALERVGFERRRNAGWGHYFGPEELDQRRPNRVTDMLRMVPGIQIDRGRYGEVVTSTRLTSMMNRCRTQFYVDGMRWPWASLDDINAFVAGNELVGVEVYRPPFVPLEFVSGFDRCLTIVLWTKMRIRD